MVVSNPLFTSRAFSQVCLLSSSHLAIALSGFCPHPHIPPFPPLFSRLRACQPCSSEPQFSGQTAKPVFDV